MVNPKLHQEMKILAVGEESLSLVVAFPKRFSKQAEKILTILRNMTTDADGKQRLMMLGLDGWQALEPSDKLKLEAK